MPTIKQLPVATSIAATDVLPVSQGGTTRGLLVGGLLSSTQSAISLVSGKLLGRISTAAGGPEPVDIGVGLAIAGTQVTATAADHVVLPLSGGLASGDEVVVNSGGAPKRMAATSLRGLFSAGSGVSISGSGTISATGVAGTAATTTSLGGVKVGNGLSVGVDGTLAADGSIVALRSGLAPVALSGAASDLTGVFGNGISVSGNGPRGSLYVLTNAPPPAVAGQTLGAQIWVGGNPTGTPGVGDSVAITSVITNENNRGNLWAANFVALQDPSGPDGNVQTVEIEVAATKSFNPDPFDSHPRTVALEITGHGGSTVRPTAAATVWASDATGARWFHSGFVLSRVADAGLRFVKNPGGVADTGAAFATAAIYDQSDSASVIKVDGSHGVFADLSGSTAVGTLIRGPSSRPTDVGVANRADFNVTWRLDSGVAGSQQSVVALSDRGTDRWWLSKNADNSFSIQNIGTGHSALTIVGDVASLYASPAAGDATTKVATTAFVQGAVQAGVAPTGLTVSAGAGYAMAAADRTVVVRKAAGSATAITLPANPVPWALYAIKDGKGDAGSNPITVSAAGSTIDGVASQTIGVGFAALTLVFDGTVWSIV